MENNVEITDNRGKDDKLDELGQWMGRKEGFSLVAGKTAAADVACLRRIRDSKLHRAEGLDWAGFCKEHVGVSNAYANRLIQHLERFGPNYFRLSQVMRISADTYSRIARAVSDAGIAFRGQTIAICPENEGKIVAAVTALRAGGPTRRPAPVVAAAQKRLEACLAELNRIRERELDEDDREDLAGVVTDGLRDLTLLSLTLRIHA
jgi:hypothetical protein